MITDYLQKTTAETWTFALKYDGRLPTGTTLSSGTVAATLADTGVTDNSVVGSTTTTVDGTQVKVVLLAGTSGQDYKLTFSTTLSDGAILVDEIILRVVD